ncbi:MAG: hypothetical protein RLZZ58_584 [Pseudomonadota bacterium]
MMIGHERAELAFLNACRQGRLHHAWLLAGAKGLGKAAFATRAARFLLANGRDLAHATSLDDADDAAAAHLCDNGTHPELNTLEREIKADRGDKGDKDKAVARSISIDQVRAMTQRLTMSIGLGHRRVIIIDAVDDLEAKGANALLKTLEEPPANSFFFLITHAPGGLLPTIRSRCRLMRFQPLDDDVMLSWLRATQPLADEALRRSAVFASHGIPGSALALMQGDAAAIESHLRAIATSGDTDNRQRERLAASVATAAAATRFETLVAIAPTLAASLAREAAPARRAAHLDAFGSIERLCRNAVQGSYEKSMVAFEIGSIFAQMNGEGAHSAFP